jgi:hypothetical protein
MAAWNAVASVAERSKEGAVVEKRKLKQFVVKKTGVVRARRLTIAARLGDLTETRRK